MVSSRWQSSVIPARCLNADLDFIQGESSAFSGAAMVGHFRPDRRTGVTAAQFDDDIERMSS